MPLHWAPAPALSGARAVQVSLLIGHSPFLCSVNFFVGRCSMESLRILLRDCSFHRLGSFNWFACIPWAFGNAQRTYVHVSNAHCPLS